MTRLVTIDIGGTHARFALAEIDAQGRMTLGEPKTLKTQDYASFQTAWEDFVSRIDGALPRDVAIAIAGPVNDEVIRFTNNPWVIRPAQIGAELGVDRVTLINDFGAVGYAVAAAEEDQFLHLAGPDEALPENGTISIVGPGTGLGVAYIHRNNLSDYRVASTEGGHLDFAPVDSIEDTILTRLRKRHRRVSVERVVSGPGIVDIYQALAAIEGRAIKELDDVAIWTSGSDGSDALAAAAIGRFCQALGGIAGDIALAQGATGVVIAGGLGYRIRETLRSSGFAERFKAKGRFESLMAQIPVRLIIHPQPGLFGAAAAFGREHLRAE